MINFPFGTNGKSIILSVPILKHITEFSDIWEQVATGKSWGTLRYKKFYRSYSWGEQGRLCSLRKRLLIWYAPTASHVFMNVLTFST